MIALQHGNQVEETKRAQIGLRPFKTVEKHSLWEYHSATDTGIRQILPVMYRQENLGFHKMLPIIFMICETSGKMEFGNDFWRCEYGPSN